MASLKPLLEIISTSVASLQSVEEKTKTQVPDLSAPFDPSSEAFRADPVARESAALIVAASLQLLATLAPPVEGLYALAAGGAYKAAALRVCQEAHVSEILREAGPQGLHVKDIAQKNGIEEKKLARFIRFLAGIHIYEEVAPDVFRNNRLSSMLDSGKPSAEVIANPDSKHENTKSPASVLIALHLDECSHAAAYTWENLSNKKTGHSYSSKDCPISTYLGRDVSYWDYVTESGQEFRRKRFDLAMEGVRAIQPADAVLGAMDWHKLPKGAKVVDVGGGIGTYTMPLAEKYPELNFVVQDLPATIANANKFWGEKNPKAIADSHVTLQVHSFLERQPLRDVSVFLLKSVIHDWSDADSKIILGNLREAATPETKLVLTEGLIPYACRLEEGTTDSKDVVPGSIIKQAPVPLLPNSLQGPMMPISDLVMFVGVNGQERTFGHTQALLLSAGWKVEEVRHPTSASVMSSYYIASPV